MSNLETTVTNNKTASESADVVLQNKIDALDNAAVKKVNGASPGSDGNVAVSLVIVTTGTLAAKPTEVPDEGDMYVVSDDPTDNGDHNGRTYISDGNVWHEITSNMAATDSRYLNSSGDKMQGDLNMDAYNIINTGTVDGRDIERMVIN